MMWQTKLLSTNATGCKIDSVFAPSNAAKQTVRRPRQREEKALRPKGFKAFLIARAEGFFSPAGSVGASALRAEVSTGDPHPTTRSACLEFKIILLNAKTKTVTFR